MQVHATLKLAVCLLALASTARAPAQNETSSLYLHVSPEAQVKAPPAMQIGPGLRRIAGTEKTQQIAYVRIFLAGKPVTPGSPPAAPQLANEVSPPVLIAQCTRDARQKQRFELLMNFGGVEDLAYYPPWKSSGPHDLFPPPTEKLDMIFDFFGYTHVKPVKRQWEWTEHVPVEARYNTPGASSRNLEEISFYMQYLKALPILRLTQGTRAVQFDTTAWLKAIHEEPLCAASGV